MLKVINVKYWTKTNLNLLPFIVQIIIAWSEIIPIPTSVYDDWHAISFLCVHLLTTPNSLIVIITVFNLSSCRKCKEIQSCKNLRKCVRDILWTLTNRKILHYDTRDFHLIVILYLDNDIETATYVEANLYSGWQKCFLV